MSGFNPPKIQRKDLKYSVKDILVLGMLNERPTFVDNPLRTFSGASHENTPGFYRNDFIKIVSKLKTKEMIRESTPKEILSKLTAADLKTILKNINKPSSGVKRELIKRVEDYATAEDILSNTDKTYFVLTELGTEVLQKHKNVWWISENKDYIFKDYTKIRFDEYYFINHLDEDPYEFLIDHYKSIDSGVVSRLYGLQENLEQAVYYGIKDFADSLNSVLEGYKKEGQFSLLKQSYLYISFMRNNVDKQIKQLNIKEDSLDQLLKYIYDFSITDHTIINYEIFKQLIDNRLNTEYNLIENHNDNYQKFDELLLELIENIKQRFGHAKNNEKEYFSSDFCTIEKTNEEKLEEILSILYDSEKMKVDLIMTLINELDMETLDKIKVEIDKRL